MGNEAMSDYDSETDLDYVEEVQDDDLYSHSSEDSIDYADVDEAEVREWKVEDKCQAPWTTGNGSYYHGKIIYIEKEKDVPMYTIKFLDGTHDHAVVPASSLREDDCTSS